MNRNLPNTIIITRPLTNRPNQLTTQTIVAKDAIKSQHPNTIKPTNPSRLQKVNRWCFKRSKID